MMILLRRRPWLWFLAAFVGMLLLFGGILAWRLNSDEEWTATKRALEAEGESFDPKDFTPPPVADAENYAALAVLNPPGVEHSAPLAVRYRDSFKNPLDIYEITNALPSLWERRSQADFATVRKELAYKYPAILAAATPAQAVLQWLDQWRTQRGELVAGLSRPAVRPLIDYEEYLTKWQYDLRLPGIQRISKLVRLHAFASLEAGQASAALDDIRVLFRLHRLIHQYPQCGRYADSIVSRIIDPLWFGLSLRRWTHADRVELLALLASGDPLQDGIRAVQRDRLVMLSTYAQRYVPISGASASTGDPRMDDISPLGAWLARTPAAVADEKSETAIVAQEVVRTVDPVRRTVDMPTLLSMHSFTRTDGMIYWRAHAHVASALTLEDIVTDAAAEQTWRNLARIALMLEDYQEAQGTYPSSLAELEGRSGFHPPHDVFGNGGEYHYRLEPGGRFTLYSVGPDGLDDGAKPPRQFEIAKDTVWTYPAP